MHVAVMVEANRIEKPRAECDGGIIVGLCLWMILNREQLLGSA